MEGFSKLGLLMFTPVFCEMANVEVSIKLIIRDALINMFGFIKYSLHNELPTLSVVCLNNSYSFNCIK